MRHIAIYTIKTKVISRQYWTRVNSVVPQNNFKSAQSIISFNFYFLGLGLRIRNRERGPLRPNYALILSLQLYCIVLNRVHVHTKTNELYKNINLQCQFE